jgi:hypothetical protein
MRSTGPRTDVHTREKALKNGSEGVVWREEAGSILRPFSFIKLIDIQQFVPRIQVAMCQHRAIDIAPGYIFVRKLLHISRTVDSYKAFQW